MKKNKINWGKKLRYAFRYVFQKQSVTSGKHIGRIKFLSWNKPTFSDYNIEILVLQPHVLKSKLLKQGRVSLDLTKGDVIRGTSIN